MSLERTGAIFNLSTGWKNLTFRSNVYEEQYFSPKYERFWYTLYTVVGAERVSNNVPGRKNVSPCDREYGRGAVVVCTKMKKRIYIVSYEKRPGSRRDLRGRVAENATRNFARLTGPSAMFNAQKSPSVYSATTRHFDGS